MFALKLLTFLTLLLNASLEDIYYVKPDNLSASCNSLPCLTLNKYAAEQSQYFITGSTFLFLDGVHSTCTTILLRNVSSIILKGRSADSALCKINVAIHCENVTDLTFQGMTLAFTCGQKDSSALNVTNGSKVLFFDVNFQNDKDQECLMRAVYLNHSNATIENCNFTGNTAYDGGAMFITDDSYITLNGNLFIGNSAEHIGGAIFAYQSKLFNKNNTFSNNSAAEAGGIYFEQCKCTEFSANFISNSASHTGGAVVINLSKVTYYDVAVTGNSGTAIFIYRSIVSFIGNTTMNKNNGSVGGAITAEASLVSFAGNTLFEENYAIIEGGAVAGLVRVHFIFSGVTIFVNNNATTEGGGAILGTVHTELLLNGSILFKNNNCTSCYGGAISLTGRSRITICDNITFESNWGEMGGAMYLRDSNVIMKQHSSIITLYNSAKFYGGAIFHMDNINYYQCNFTSIKYQKGAVLFSLPDCFLELENFKFNSSNESTLYEIHSYNDSAGIDGQFIYGGLMDKCHVIDTQEKTVQYDLLYNIIMDHHILHIEPNGTKGTNAISSEAFTLCFCDNDLEYDCLGSRNLSTIRGSRFNVSLLALSQGNIITAPVLTAKVRKTARLGLNQNTRNLTAKCTNLSYNMYSTEEKETLHLYPNESCQNWGLAVAILEVIFLPCPDGFIKSLDHCICEERLQKYNAECTVYDKENYITRKNSPNFWVDAVYLSNDSYQGLILYRSCPIDYCKTVDVNITLRQPDVQCDFNHSGKLCGACATNHSLMLGNSRCQKCSNEYILLLVAFAAAGIILVTFLSILRLTVATGMINSIILYANIVQANKTTFFLKPDINVLTVFIAWMNLDLGIPTCFYHGMDAYAHTWLQFLFPIYIWILLSLIIITSRYSTVMTKLIGSNPIAVLATLLLMSYTKILKSLIQIFSSVELEYPDNEKVTVWLKDANIPYLKSKHLILAVVSSIFVAFFFLPYTILLLVGYKLYYFSENRCVHWIMIRMKPPLDSYYAPYEKHTHYWTGFLLLVRCALYIIFSFDSIGGTDYSLLAIVTIFTAVIVIAWLSVKIYKSFYVNAIEALVYLNLIILSAATSNQVNSLGLVYSLVGMVFTIMLGIIYYHFHLFYIAKSTVWLKFASKLTYFLDIRKRSRNMTDAERAPLIPSSDARHVTKSVLNLRESLMEEPCT